MQKISVIIPTYKNTELLLSHLQSNLPFLKDCEIIIVNDDPTVSIKERLKEYGSLTLIENDMNLGFGESVNKGVNVAHGDFILLLNNDVGLQDDKFRTALKFFTEDPKLFAVSFAQIEKDSSIVGKNTLYWQKGFIQHKKNNSLTAGINAWAEGGSCIIDKQKFIQLKGFDKLYSPFYWEDIDLSYRAWKAGFTITFDPKIVVVHHHESTIGSYFNKNNIQEIAFRNQLIFIWKNINSSKLLFEHLLYLFPAIIRGKLTYTRSFLQALSSFFAIMQYKIKSHYLLSDIELLSKFK